MASGLGYIAHLATSVSYSSTAKVRNLKLVADLKVFEHRFLMPSLVL